MGNLSDRQALAPRSLAAIEEGIVYKILQKTSNATSILAPLPKDPIFRKDTYCT